MRACFSGAAGVAGPALLLAGFCSAALAPSSHAGTYDVVACAAGGGAVQRAFVPLAAPGMAAYSSCPNAPNNPETGIVTRASAAAGPAFVPALAGAYQMFAAPAGASLASVSFDVAAIRLASYWTTGIVAYDGDFNIGDLPYGCYAGIAGCGLGTPAYVGGVTVPLNGHTRFRFETRCGSSSGCDISASGFRPGTRALFSAANVRVSVQDFTRPQVSPAHGELWGSGWHRGREQAWQSMTDNVGVMLERLHVDGAVVAYQDYRDPHWPDYVRCDFSNPRPCHDISPGGIDLDTRTLTDGTHAIAVEAVDAAGNSAAIDHTIHVDNTAPAHVAVVLDGGEAWRRENGFAVRWQRPPESGSPMAKVHYELCPARGGACLTRASPSGADELAGIHVPAAGEHALRLWLEDAAGNASPANASAAVALRFDDVAPEAAFELLDEDDPLLLEVRASDVGSGVEAGSIEMRRAGRRQWHELDTSAAPGVLRARVDDVGAADGAYQFRAIVRDRAGNERIGDRRVDGAPMELTLPLRSAARLSLAAVGRVRACRRVRKRTRLRCRRYRGGERRDVLRGAGRVRGKLESAAGKPIVNGRVRVLETRRGTPGVRQLTAVATDANGVFVVAVPRGPSRTLRFAYDGTPLSRPASADVQVRSPARTTIRVSRRRLRNGDSVRFSGRLLGGPFPEGGKLIDLQAHYRNQWRTFATPRSDSGGRWRFDYRFGATRGVVTYRFRARVRRETAYPYELGYSRVVRVTVRGP
jgi:hypothetical protein